MVNKNLILIGGGGHCKSVIEAAESAGWQILGILDMPGKIGEKLLGYEIIGTDNEISKWVDKASFVVTVGHIKTPEIRIALYEQVIQAGGHFATVVASGARVSKHAVIGNGTVILHGAVVNAAAQIGKGCIINTLANIEHDAVIGDFCHISTGAMVNGNCSVEHRVFLGSQSVMVNGISIAEGAVIAAGSVVRKNILKKGIYSGNPAILMKTI